VLLGGPNKPPKSISHHETKKPSNTFDGKAGAKETYTLFEAHMKSSFRFKTKIKRGKIFNNYPVKSTGILNKMFK